ncbi:ATP-binding protein [Candidatus Gracilibacteria bacterium]|nr:ATP-binding protein [Candidatus Gracilibacteria bacterium]
MFIEKILKESIIERDFYLNKIEKYHNTPLIKVLIGQRRVGKSTLLKSIIQKMYSQNELKKENILYINKELPTFDHIHTYEDLKKEFKVFLTQTSTGKILVGIDEVQEIKNWEKFINGISAEYQENIEIYITGSNSFLLSGELATYLTGRYVEFHILPLSFQEFCIFKKDKENRENFIEYLKYGGLPAIFKMHYEDEVIFPYLLGVYNTIIVKDVIQHHEIRNVGFFKDLYRYSLGNIGSIISGKSIKNYLKSQGISLGNETVLNFLSYALETFILHKVYSVNPETKKYFEIYNKYYAGDLGIRNALTGYDFKRDIGKLIENYVYLELQRYDYDVRIGRLKSGKEIDFIATKNGITKYFQVCYLLGSEDTIEREYSSLKEVSDNWEKYVVSFDEIDFGNHDGIRHVNVMNMCEVL